ncbi:integrase catalytic domain-containing protein [Trichonephila clavipes]|nr:integrase catalytic domain-containing protein [Trichonephila clavipes]
MFKGAKKEDLRRIASELELCVSDKLTVLDFMDLIKNCDRYKNDPDSAHELANLLSKKGKSSFVNLKFFVNAAKKKHHSSLCFSGDPNFTSERVIQPSSLGAERAGNRGILDESTFSEGVCVQTHKLHREISKEVSSQGLGDLFTATSYVKSKSVLLATAICFIRDSFGKMQEVRALLDGGSTSNFISQQCMNRLNLKREKINILVSGLNNSELTIKSRVNATIANRGNSYETNADFFVVPRITDVIPSQPFNVSLGNFSREKLADENFNIPRNIDLLLGAEIFYEILLPGQTNLLNTKLIFQNTVFGYIASGSIPVSSENKPHCGLIKDNVDLEKTTRRFWEIENVEPETIKNKETIICEEHFQKNHARDSTGRYIVSMPFKKDPNCLGQSKDIALKKLNSLWNRLKHQRKLQRILWRENMDEPIKTFELSTVTYGTTSAPFLATRTLKQLALDEAGNFPLGLQL